MKKARNGVTFQANEELLALAEAKAARSGKTLQQLCPELLAQYVGRRDLIPLKKSKERQRAINDGHRAIELIRNNQPHGWPMAFTAISNLLVWRDVENARSIFKSLVKAKDVSKPPANVGEQLIASEKAIERASEDIKLECMEMWHKGPPQRIGHYVLRKPFCVVVEEIDCEEDLASISRDPSILLHHLLSPLPEKIGSNPPEQPDQPASSETHPHLPGRSQKSSQASSPDHSAVEASQTGDDESRQELLLRL